MKFSIITITYNAEKVLQRTLDSVRSQTYRDMEHLIVDGASTDETVAMAEAYRQQASYDVIIQSEPDRGIYDAMNKGLRLATGDYVVFMNAGDTFHDERTLERVLGGITELRNSGTPELRPAVIYGDTAITDSEGNFLHLRTHRPPERLSWKSFKQGMLVCHQAFYVRTEIARQCPYDLQYRHSADVDWCIRVMKEAEKRQMPLVNTHAILANFEEGGDTTQHHRDSLKERFRVMAHHYGLLQTIILHGWFVIRQLFRNN